MIPPLNSLLGLTVLLFGAPPEEPGWKAVAEPFLRKHCASCHQGTKAKGGFSVEKLVASAASSPREVDLWSKVAEQVRSHSMPPENKPQPSTGELDALNGWIDEKVLKLACAGPPDPGKVTARRLNRQEYANTLRDLLSLTSGNPSEDLPADDVGYGFDNIADVLSVSSLHLEKYLANAEKYVEQALATPAARVAMRLPHASAMKKEGLDEFLRTFGERAFRRPMTEAEFSRYSKAMHKSFDESKDANKALAGVYQAILVSPHFLFRIEPDPVAPQTTRSLNSYEMASRLSYFLWSSMPDAELFNLAKSDSLKKPDVLEAQVKRMLADKKATAFVANFAGQWLNLRNLDNLQPDPGRFQRFNEALRFSMKREAEMYFTHILREDRSVLEFIDSDYTFLNDTLARHYGLPRVSGSEMRKVKLPENHARGGLITMAAVLTLTSNPTRTSPVKRGKWILEVLLGTPPPPPPPGVEELKDDKKGELKGTLRQKMEQHRANPNCAVCHQKLDPLGFGLENFDAVGAWREKENGEKIDSTGVLPGNEKFEGPKQLKSILLKKKDLFARNLAERLLTYALGRGTESSDRCALDKMAESAKEKNYKMSVLILEVVQSEAFRSKKIKSPGGVS